MQVDTYQNYVMFSKATGDQYSFAYVWIIAPEDQRPTTFEVIQNIRTLHMYGTALQAAIAGPAKKK